MEGQGQDRNPDLGSKWRYNTREYNENEKISVLAKVFEVGIRTTFLNHIYMFKNELYHQQAGGAIGLRLTGVVARILMDRWADIQGHILMIMASQSIC